MALELARAQAGRAPSFVLSLEGEADEALRAWPRLLAQRDQLLFAGKRPGLDPLLLPRLVGRLRALRPRCVHTHHAGPLLYGGAAARLAGVRRRIHTEHDAWHLQDAKRRRLVRAALRIARPVLVADAPHVANAVRDALHCAMPRVILNGIDTVRFAPGNHLEARERFGIDPAARVIGVAARLERVKGVDIALDAFARLDMPGALLLIAGDGGERAALRDQAHRLGIESRVRFAGLVEDMPGFFNALDVFCLPSRAEGLPLSILEAQSCGVAVVASDVGGVAAALSHDVCMAVPPLDVNALAFALRNVLRETSARTGHRQAARDFVVCNASLDKAADAYFELAMG
jgi:glycosyltransferase involved in cell wall biosynthesis